MKPIILSFIYLFIISCSTKDNINNYTITIDIDKQNKISIFDIFSKVEVIPLETTDESLISGISKILIYQDTIFIFDRKLHEIFIFTQNGKYISKINKRGRGAGEYTLISDFKMNPFTKKLEVLDPMGRFFIFNPDGSYIQSFRLPDTLHAYDEFIALNKDTIVFHSGSEKYNLNLYSRSSSKIIYQSFKSNRKLDINSPITSFYRFQDTIYFSQYLYDIVYQITDQGIHPDYEWFLPDYDYKPEEVIPSYNRNNAKEYFSIQELIPYVYINNLQNNLYQYACISPKSDIKYLSLFHNKKTNKNIVFEKTTEGVIFTPHLLNDSVAIGPVEPWRKVKEYLNAEILDEENLKILNNLSENDNPILIKYSFK